MEICRKLDSIRSSGFPDADGASLTGGAAGTGPTSGDDDVNVSGPPPPRPRSEPLPESIPALTSFSGEERRPGTAASGRRTDAAVSLLGGGSRGEAGDAGVGTVPETETIGNDELEREEGGGSRSSSGSVGPSPKGRPKHTSSGSGSGEEGQANEPGANVSDEGTPAGDGPESDNIDVIVAQDVGVPSVVPTKTARNRDQKASSIRREKVRFWGVETARWCAVLPRRQ